MATVPAKKKLQHGQDLEEEEVGVVRKYTKWAPGGQTPLDPMLLITRQRGHVGRRPLRVRKQSGGGG